MAPETALHKAGTAFMAAADELYFGAVVERIEHGKIAFARHAKHAIYLVVAKRDDQILCSGIAHEAASSLILG
jgi:hypothetical protein